MSAYRINIIGTSGSGKTTTAARAAAILGVPHVELDALNWGPNWTERPQAVFEQLTRDAVAQDAWVICGNYSRVRRLVWERATMIVWLDYPQWLVTARVVRRTLQRVCLRKELWSGNRERFLTNFRSRESIIWWSITTYDRRKRQYGEIFAQAPPAGVRLVRLRSPRETERWLAALRADVKSRDRGNRLVAV